MQDAEQAHGDEPTTPAQETASAGTTGPADKAAAEDLDWFEDVPEENVGAVLSLDEVAPHPGI
ncbi:hypothetical protein ABZ178_31495 [Streptomyces massasporeus]|uniref:hypothetical protein n=1 Tax=Streptomyces massasporeus TaxID=67324 RepID=UPI0016760891|nr:hypothetical protein [Streptomyces massasporeus]GGV58565.1 hypothetical protein GCM10010228_04490 [Streptomyces massasporeus]